LKNNQLPRRERDKRRQRREILSAALILFSEKGYHNVSMQEIAEAAEFAVGTLYNFFQNKEELYKALVLEQCEAFEDAIIQAMEKPGDALEKLRNYTRAKSEMFRSRLSFVRLFLSESKGVSFNIKTGLDEELRNRYYGFMERLALIFEAGINQKQFKNIAEPYFLAVALDSVIDAFLLLWLQAPDRYPYPEEPDIILNIFIKPLIDF
jgi:TetR/AcrR family transcriptional regulator